jgi:hypothetical protein
MTEKSILEQALLQVQNLEEAVKQNAKGILASTMKEELKDLLKESLEEEEEVAKDEEEETQVDEQPTPEEEEDDMSDDDAEADDTENDTDLDNEPSKDIEGLDGGADENDSLELPDFDAEDNDDDVLDMTTASDDEVLKVFKAMKPEDGIVVKKDGDNIDFNTGEDEYIIKLDGGDSLETEDTMELPVDGLDSEEDTTDFPPVSDDMAGDDDSEVEEEETIYEIELDEEEEEEEEVSEEEEESKEIEATEAARTQANDVRGEGPRQGMKYKAGRHEMNEEVENLKKQNAEYKKALVLFKDKLNEVAVFNANLAYATRLFTEHSTTKQEKLNILKRFDTVSTMNEAKSLFNTIKTELGSKTTVTESVATKISNTPSSSSSTEVLAESKAYENPQFRRIKEMMSKIK